MQENVIYFLKLFYLQAPQWHLMFHTDFQFIVFKTKAQHKCSGSWVPNTTSPPLHYQLRLDKPSLALSEISIFTI